MKDLVFEEQMRRLSSAFQYTLNESSMKIYHEELTEIEDLVFVEVIQKIIRREERFPSIAKILDYAGLGPRISDGYKYL